MGYGAAAVGEVTEQRKWGEGEGVTDTEEQDWERSQLETGHSAESRRLLGMRGSVGR